MPAQFKLEWKGLEQLDGQLHKALPENWLPTALREAIGHMKASTAQKLQEKKGWPPLSASYRRQLLKAGVRSLVRGRKPGFRTLLHAAREVKASGKLEPTLIRTRTLLDSFGVKGGHMAIEEVGRDRAEFGSNVPYAAIHEFGGMTGRGHKANIPARPYFHFDEQDEARIGELMDEHLTRALEGL